MFVSDDSNEQLQAAISAGTAVELLAKAYLASIDEALLADKGDRDTILLLTGNSKLTESDPLAMKTIGALEAVRTVKKLHKDLPLTQQNPIVFGVRNSAAHMALVRSDDLRAAVIQMCRIIESLILALGLDRRDFWEIRGISVVDALLDEASTEIAREVAAKKAAAAARLEGMLASLPDSARSLLLSALSGREMSSTDYEHRQQCPVCDQQGWLPCVLEYGQERREIDEYGKVIKIVDCTAYPVGFECPVCELCLEGDELLEFDFPRQLEFEPEKTIVVHGPDEGPLRHR